MARKVDAIPKGTSSLTTITLPLAIWGEGYAEFLPRWWDGVLSLNRKPDEVSIVADVKNFKAVIETWPKTDIPVKAITYTGEDYADFWNKAISEATSEWVAICNVDDQFLPPALDQIDQADTEGCNLVCDSIQDKGSHNVTMSSWRPDVVAHTWTMVGAEPMKKSLWEASGGFRKGFLFADWALAMDMAKTGLVKAFDASTLRIIYDRGYDRKTLSGAMQDGNKKSEGYAMLRELASQLGLN